jgi:ABC-type siderophore export system fused ATPase/permease subunit
MLQKISITYEIRLSVRWAANILITVAVLVFLKLATILYKNVEKLNVQYVAQAWFTVFKINPFYNNKKCKQCKVCQDTVQNNNKKCKQCTGVSGYCAE